MATIRIHALNPTGSDLLTDNESYLKELSDSELNIQGGYVALSVLSALCLVTYFWEP